MTASGRPRTDAVLRFVRFVASESGPRGCWLWTGVLDRDGVGGFTPPGGFRTKAPRVAWQMAHGVALEPHERVLQVCQESRCVRPDTEHVVVPSREAVRRGQG